MRTLSPRYSARRPDWFCDALGSIRRDGFAIVEDVLAPALLGRTREAMYAAYERILGDVGQRRPRRGGERGVLHLLLRHDGLFYSLLELEEVLDVVDVSLSSTAILHRQHGLVVVPHHESGAGDRGETAFRQDFPHYLEGYVASISTVLAIDDCTPDNGAALLVPGSHQRSRSPAREEMEALAVPALCPAGSMIAFDSTLWYAPGVNRSDRDRLAIDQQFTRSFITPQVDWVRALGDEMVLRRDPRTQQLLGWYTRMATSLDEL